MSDNNDTTMEDVFVKALATQYHRYVIWNKKANTPNYHGSINVFYGELLSDNELQRVVAYYNEHWSESI